MKIETQQVLGVRAAVAKATGTDRRWRVTLILIAIAITAVLGLYWQTALTMVATWLGTDSFAHGLLIVPITLVLIWRKRAEVAAISPHPHYLGFVLLVGAGFAWLVGAAGQVLVLQQYAMTAMIPAAVIAVAGLRVALALAFPLAFLLFAVPAGDAFVPRLMDWTADFSVGALRLTGVPVYREGNVFAIPSGRWSIVEACSGLRYLIASVTVGTLFAYLNYRRLWKQVLFIAVSIAVPIAANFLRAYLIVMIGHLSNMRLGVGVDHVIYGWVFFGAVMLILFWLASFFRDPAPVEARAKSPWLDSERRLGPLAGAAAGVVALAAAWPLYGAYLERGDTQRAAPALTSAPGAAGWMHDPGVLTHWRPHYVGTSASTFDVYRKGERAVALYVGYYRHQRQGAELINWQNGLVSSKSPLWTIVGEAARTLDFGQGLLDVRETRLSSGRQQLLAWDWYRIAGADSSNPYLVKARLARDRLLGRGDDSAVIILAAPYEMRPEEASETLQLFAREMLPGVYSTLAAAARSASE